MAVDSFHGVKDILLCGKAIASGELFEESGRDDQGLSVRHRIQVRAHYSRGLTQVELPMDTSVARAFHRAALESQNVRLENAL